MRVSQSGGRSFGQRQAGATARRVYASVPQGGGGDPKPCNPNRYARVATAGGPLRPPNPQRRDTFSFYIYFAVGASAQLSVHAEEEVLNRSQHASDKHHFTRSTTVRETLLTPRLRAGAEFASELSTAQASSARYPCPWW